MLNSRIFILPLIVILILAVTLFSFFGIGSKSIWLDEACSVHVASHNFKGIIANAKSEGDPPFYYLLLALWIRAFGIGEFAVRSLSGTFYILSLVAVYLLGKSLYDQKTGLLCSFLYMLSPLTMHHAQNARMYSLLGLLGILSTLFFLRLFLIKTNSKKDLTLYIVVNILGTFTHYWFVFIILSQVISHILLFSRSSFKKFLIAIFISAVPFLVLWSPILLFHMNNGSASWIAELGKPGRGYLLYTLTDFYGGEKLVSLVSIAFLTLIVFRIKGFRSRFRKISVLKEFIFQKQSLIFLIFLSVSLLVPRIISQVKPICVLGRTSIVPLLPFVMLLGSFLSRFGNKLLILVLCAILLIPYGSHPLSNSFITQRTIPQQYSDRLTTEYLIEHANNDDILIFTSLSQAAIDYYLRLMKPNKDFIEISFPSEIESHLGWRDINRMLKRKDELESEAESVVNRIDTLVKDSDTKIWLFYGSDIEIGEILKGRLDTYFSLREEKDLRGPYYNKILVYQK